MRVLLFPMMMILAHSHYCSSSVKVKIYPTGCGQMMRITADVVHCAAITRLSVCQSVNVSSTEQ